MTPHFQDINAFLAMGGHGFYVWLCWGLVLMSVLFGIWFTKHERKKAKQKIATLHARKQQHKKPSQQQG